MTTRTRRSQYDLDIGGVKLMLARGGRDAPAMGGVFTGSDTEQRPTPQAQPIVFEDFSRGIGVDYDYGDGVDTRTPGVVLAFGAITEVSLPTNDGMGRVRGGFERGGDMFFIANRHLLRLTSGTGAPAIYQDLGSGFQAYSVAPYGEDIIIGGTGGGIWRIGGSVSQSSDMQRKHVASAYTVVDDEPQFRLYGSDVTPGTSAAFQFTANANPLLAANWGTVYTVGDGRFEIDKMVSTGQAILFLKRDGVYWSTDYRAVNLTPYWATSMHDANGQCAQVLGPYLYAGHVRGPDRINLGSTTQRHLPEFVPPTVGPRSNSPVRGWPTAMANDGEWLVCSFYDGSTSRILYGIPRRRADVPYPMEWHGVMATFAGEEVSHLQVTSPNNEPRLWVASMRNGTEPHLYWISLPKSGSSYLDHVNGGPMTYQSQWKVYSLPLTWGDGNARKSMVDFDVNSENLDDNRTIQLAAAADSTSYTAQGTASGSPSSSFVAILDGGYQIRLRWIGTGTASEPAIMTGAKAAADVIARQAPVHSFRVIIGRDVELRYGPLDRRNPDTTFAHLFSLQNTGRITIKEHNGSEFVGKLLPGVRWVEEPDPDTQGAYRKVVSFSVRVLKQVLRWNDGTIWDQPGAFWG